MQAEGVQNNFKYIDEKLARAYMIVHKPQKCRKWMAGGWRRYRGDAAEPIARSPFGERSTVENTMHVALLPILKTAEEAYWLIAFFSGWVPGATRAAW